MVTRNFDSFADLPETIPSLNPLNNINLLSKAVKILSLHFLLYLIKKIHQEQLSNFLMFTSLA